MKKSYKTEPPTEIFGYSEDMIVKDKMRVFSLKFRAITKAERETIKKIIGITHCPIMVKKFAAPSKLVFMTKINYTSFKKMYEENGIDEDLIQNLKFKGVIKKIKRYPKGLNPEKVFMDFTSDCNFSVDFCTRKVLMEKHKEKNFSGEKHR